MGFPVSLVVALSLAQGTAELSADVDVRPLGANQHELTITIVGTTDPAAAQHIVPSIAERVCGTRVPVLGRYKFEGREPVKSPEPDARAELTFIQTIECVTPGEASTDDAPIVPSAAEGQPTAEEEAMILARTIAYLTAKDEGQFDTARSMLAPTTAGMFKVQTWQEPRTRFNANAGEIGSRDVIRLTLYDNPADAPTPGRYVAADYRGDYASGAFYCGYVMWLRQHDGTYLIVREEEGQLDPATRAELTEQELASMRVRLGCRD